MKKYSITNPEVLMIQDGSRTYFGSNQSWYRQEWQRRAGCGPTTAAQIFWYLGKVLPQYAPFKKELPITKNNILSLMEEVWDYVTPTTMGLNSPYIYQRGVEAYAASKGVDLQAEVLFVDTCKSKRPTLEAAVAFIAESIEHNLPVAFLNLSNGVLTNLDAWHWVTLTGIDTENAFATMFDQGRRLDIDLKSWLSSSFLGGAFVRIVA